MLVGVDVRRWLCMYLKQVECYVGEWGYDVHVECDLWLRHFGTLTRM
jgi:hypothetical protein